MPARNMKALRFEKYGPSVVLSIQDLPLPVLQADEVLVQVKASSINPSDLGSVAGRFSRDDCSLLLALLIFWIQTSYLFPHPLGPPSVTRMPLRNANGNAGYPKAAW